MFSEVAIRMFATRSPGISRALVRVTARYGAVVLCAHFVRVFRSL